MIGSPFNTAQLQFFELPRDRQNSSKNRGFEKARYSDKKGR